MKNLLNSSINAEHLDDSFSNLTSQQILNAARANGGGLLQNPFTIIRNGGTPAPPPNPNDAINGTNAGSIAGSNDGSNLSIPQPVLAPNALTGQSLVYQNAYVAAYNSSFITARNQALAQQQAQQQYQQQQQQYQQQQQPLPQPMNFPPPQPQSDGSGLPPYLVQQGAVGTDANGNPIDANGNVVGGTNTPPPVAPTPPITPPAPSATPSVSGGKIMGLSPTAFYIGLALVIGGGFFAFKKIHK